MAMVTANCWLSRPWIPPMSAIGMKTAERTRAMPTTGPETSDMALSVASRGDSPSSMWCSTASTTTIASSTTRPMASTSANSDSVLIEKPRKGKNAKAPTSDTGTAMSGMRVARQFWRNRKTTRITRTVASSDRGDDLLDALGDREGGVEADLVVHVAREAPLAARPSSS